jgi:hypothetical protein
MLSKNETEQIMDYLTNRIDVLNGVNKVALEVSGQQDYFNVAKIQELEDIRAFIAVNFY